ncbi:MAG: FMN-binding protein [Candidatus Alcyoniella australis]|nr:FMN-binding protein [Candidatus Alcyoniella australis]
MKLFEPRFSKTFWWCLTLLCLGCIVAHHAAHNLWQIILLPSETRVARLVPGTVSIERLERVGTWRLSDSAGQVNYAILTTAVEPEVEGYRGPISVLIAIDSQGRISAAELLEHHETPYYINLLLEQRFIDRLVGLDLSAADPQVDMVSGATVSSQAILRDVSASSLTLLHGLGTLQVDAPPLQIDWYRAALALSALLFAIAALALRSRLPWLRWVVWIINLALVGLLLKAPLSFAGLADLVAGRPPGALNIDAALILYAALLGSLLFGRFHCRAVCPFGVMQRLVAAASPVARRSTGSAGASAVFLAQMPLLVLAGLTIATFGCGLWSIAPFEPYALLFSGWRDPLRLAYAGLALLPCLFFPLFWCRFVCPTGAGLDLVSRLARRRIRPWTATKDRDDEQ